MKTSLEAGQTLLPGYRLVRFLGRGGFGEVWEVEAPGRVAKAMKVSPIVNADSKQSCRELEGIQKIRSIRHPFLLSIERFDVVDGLLLIIMELAERSLADRFDECIQMGMVGVPRDELIGYLHEAAEALDLLNLKHNLFHLDVKPENLFTLGGHIKVADFGLIQSRTAGTMCESIAITPPYAPPEVFDGLIETSVDQYGLAVTFQEMLTGHRPYSACDIRGIVYQHLRSGPNLAPLPTGDRAIVRKALHPDPAQRYKSCTDFVKALAKAESFPEVRPPSSATRLSPTPSTGDVSSSAETKPNFVLHPVRRRQDKTTAITTTRHRTVKLDFSLKAEKAEPLENQVQVHFVAFLPLEIFAHKLRGFIADLQAETLTIDPDRTVLRFRPAGIFSGRKAVFLQIDTCTRNTHSGFRGVEATAWTLSAGVTSEELCRRGHLLIRYLKAHLMAVDREPLWGQLSSAQIRAAIFE